MDITQTILTLLAAASIPSAVTGLLFWRFQKKIEKSDRAREQKEKAREENEVMLIQKVDAALALGEATARAVQRIPDARCNGDMTGALEYAAEVKRKHRKFMTEQGVHHIYES